MDSAAFTVEAQYIKNLQQQIYFLEMEASFLREQTKKATDLKPHLAMEAEHLLRKLLALRSESEGLKVEVKRKDANLLMLQRDHEHVKGQIRDSEASHSEEKRRLLEEIVQIKQIKELTDRQISQKEMDILHSKQELEREMLSLADTNQRLQALKAQLKQRSENQKEMENQLSLKRTELLKTNSDRHEMEEKLLKYTATTPNQLTLDLRNEISFLHQQICEKDLQSEQNSVLRKKMMDNCASLTSENSILQTQLLELSKQLEVRALKEENYIHNSSSVAQLLVVKDREEQLSQEIKWHQALLQKHKDQLKDLIGQIDLLMSGNTLQSLNTSTLNSQIAELHAMLAKEEQINTELKGDKALLVDHVGHLQNQITTKETDLLHISARIEELDRHISTITSEHSLQRSLQSVRWKEISDLAGSMKQVSRSLTELSLEKY
ncbi:early endosome antigen 1-like isoform X2 [Hyperolius riggenbachi]|uniref:early endosome antigen 1-like isoform X2 n=1 Tax=Hyperolius riggenbachi TaxID=752182 RepID=UPI0035A322A4